METPAEPSHDYSFWLKYEYPLTVISDRYGGCYSHGNFTAWPLIYEAIPWEPEGGDMDCMAFWESYKEPCGRGLTMELALQDLRRQIKELKS